jgi:hypothetical protein
MHNSLYPIRWVITGTILASLAVLTWWGWVSPRTSNCILPKNGAWISVDWTSQSVSQDAIAQLARDASTRNIRYLFPFTTYLKPDGTFSPSYDYAADFVSRFHRFEPEIQVLAWIGIPLKNNRSIGVQGWVDLADPATRQKIVTFVAKLMEEAKFDGVHLNVETVQNNDPNFLLLLQEVRSALGPQRMISVTGSHWAPGLLNALPFVKDFRWTSDYYQAVAGRVDQIATMTYDSYMPTPALYRLWLREEVRGISSSLANSEVELLIGISVSREDTSSHHPTVEDLQNGLGGLCAAQANSSQPEDKVQGAAIYADWEFAEKDWQLWREWQKW